MLMKRHFSLEYWIDDGWYVGGLKEIPGIFSQGETLEELEKNIRDAYTMMIEDEVSPPALRITNERYFGGRGVRRGNFIFGN